MRPLLKQIAELVGGAMRDMRSAIEPRLKSLEERDPTKLLEDLRKDLVAAKEALNAGEQSIVKITMDNGELQKLLESTAEEMRQWFEDAKAQSLKGFDERVKSFDDAARIREGSLNEMSGQLRALLSERSGQPTLDAVVRDVVKELRQSDDTLLARCKEAAVAALESFREGVESKLLAMQQRIDDIPSADALAKAAAELVPAPVVPVAPDLSGFLKVGALDALLTRQAELVAQVKELSDIIAAMPSARELAKAAAEFVPAPVIPVAPDLSGFATREEVAKFGQGLTAANEALNEMSARVSSLPSAKWLAEAASELVPRPVAPDLSGLAKKEDVEALTSKQVALGERFEALANAVPSADALAKAAAALVPAPVMPVAPDLSGLATREEVKTLGTRVEAVMGRAQAAAEKAEAIPTAEAVAKAAVALLPEPLKIEDVAKAAAALVPAGKDGVAPTTAEVVETVKPQLDVLVNEWRDAMRDQAQKIVSDALAQIPVVKDGVDGKSFTLEEVQALVAKAMSDVEIPTAQDVAASLEGSHLAKWALDFERRAQDLLQRCVDRLPTPKDGVDGMGFEDLTVEYDGVRTFTFAMVKDARRKAFEFKVPVMIHRGVYNESMAYDKGDVTTWGGSAWLALKDLPQGKPGVGTSHDWQLIVKKGSDGRSK